MSESPASTHRPADEIGHRSGEAADGHPSSEAAPHGDVRRVIPVLAETLEVERRTLPGAVRLRKQVEDVPVDVDESFAQEVVDVERVLIGRPLQGPAEIRHEGDTLIVPVVQEQLVIEKRLVLAEELRIRRRTETRHVTESRTLRREQVIVERYDPQTQTWSTVDTPLSTASPAPDGAAPAAREAAAPPTPAPSADAPSFEAAPPRQR